MSPNTLDCTPLSILNWIAFCLVVEHFKRDRYMLKASNLHFGWPICHLTFMSAYKPLIHIKHHGTARNINLPLCITTQLKCNSHTFLLWLELNNLWWLICVLEGLSTIKEFRCYEVKIEKGVGVKLSGCHGSVAEHWRPSPDVSWVRLYCAYSPCVQS